MRRHLSGPIASDLAQHQRSSLDYSFKQSRSRHFPTHISKKTDAEPLPISSHHRPRLLDFVFTATAVVAQPITGILLSQNRSYIVTGGFWLPVVWMQVRMRDLAESAVRQGCPLPLAYYKLFWFWFSFGFPAFGTCWRFFG